MQARPHRPRGLLAACALAGTLLGLAGAPSAVPAAVQQQPRRPVFRAQVELVRLQVIVAGRDGEFVGGLGPGDFRLDVEGRERPLEIVEEVDLDAPGAAADTDAGAEPARAPDVRSAPGATAARARPAGDKEPRPALDPWTRRRFLLFLDPVFVRPEKFEVARRAALAFVREMVRPEDLVGLATHGLDGVRILLPFSERHQQVARAIEGIDDHDFWLLRRAAAGPQDDAQEFIEEAEGESARGGGQLGAGLSLTRSLLPAWRPGYIEAALGYLTGLRELGRALQAIPGRKHLLLFSPGISDDLLEALPSDALADFLQSLLSDPLAQTGSEPRIRELLDEASAALRDGDVAVHALSTARLGTSTFTPPSTMGSGFALGGGSGGLPRFGMASLWQLADETGGSMRFHTHHLEGAVARVERLTRRYYILAYRRLPDDPPVVKLRVRSRRADVKVVYAPTRLAPPPPFEQMSPTQRQLQMAGLLEAGIEANDLRVRAQAAVDDAGARTGVVLVGVSVPPAELARLARLRGDGEAEIEVVALAREPDGGAIRGVVAGTLGVTAGQGRLSGLFVLPPGPYEIRLAAREVVLGLAVTRRLPVQLAAGDDGRALRAGPLLVDVSEPDRQGVRSFGLTLLVFHLRSHPFTGRAQARVLVQLVGPDGTLTSLDSPTVVGRRFIERIDADLIELRGSLPPLPPRRARLRLTATDPVAGSRVRIEQELPLPPAEEPLRQEGAEEPS